MDSNNKITYAAYSEQGNRDLNEDAIGTIEDSSKYCFVLCDGLGGHGMGEIASGLVVSVFSDIFSKIQNSKSFLATAFRASQDILMTEQVVRNAHKKMKTTAVSLLMDKKFAYIGHIGDSRLYVFRKNKVVYRTLDHSIPQMLALSHDIKEEEIRNHPDRNMVLRVLGVDWDKDMFEISKPFPLKKCQAFLLCSDGFWELIDEQKMCSILKTSSSVEEWLSQMEDEVKSNGIDKNMDNNSAIAIWCGKGE